MLRRDFVILSGRALVAMSAAQVARIARADDAEFERALGEIERRVAGRLGVAAFDTATGRSLTHRAQERFPMCSTFKWLLAAQVLARVDASDEQLSRVIPYGPDDLLEWAPVTRKHVAAGGMTVAEMAEAAVSYSDNTAANLLLAAVGGPGALTEYLRSIGDQVTRLDRIEPELNTSIPGDPRDTTSPAATIEDLHALLLGDRLAPSSRDLLLGWMRGNTTGDERLRAGLPSSWQVGDKTGTGPNGSTNDVAIFWPPEQTPVLVAAYLTETDADMEDRNRALAEVARVIAQWITGTADNQQ